MQCFFSVNISNFFKVYFKHKHFASYNCCFKGPVLDGSLYLWKIFGFLKCYVPSLKKSYTINSEVPVFLQDRYYLTVFTTMQRLGRGLAIYPIPRNDIKKNLQYAPTVKFFKININSMF